MCGESNMETYITICTKMANGNFLFGSGNLNRILYQAREVGGAGDGREVQKGGNICIVDSYLGLTKNNKIL